MTRPLPLRIAALFTLFLALGAPPLAPQARADKLVRYDAFGAWKIDAALDASGRLTRCIATGRYKSGIYFAIIYHADKQFWYLQFFDPKWPERKGQTRATLRVDGAQMSTTNLLWRSRSAFVSLGRSVDSVIRLMKGKRLTVETTAGSTAFRLDGSFGATKKVVECVKRYKGVTTASPGGAFGVAPGGAAGPAPGQGAFGVAPGKQQGPGKQGPDWKLPRADTLQYAVTYLDKRGRAYRILPEDKHIFKHLPVNWVYSKQAYGGMVAFRPQRMRGAEALNIMIASHTRICDIKSAIVRDKPVTNGATSTLRAKGACEATKGKFLADFSVIERNGHAVFMIVEMLDQSPGAVDRQPPPSGKRRPLPQGVQEG